MVLEREEAKAKKKELGPAECECSLKAGGLLADFVRVGWFCLSNPKVTKHLIVAIGAETYVTLPKGQLIPTDEGKSLVPGGGHVLVCSASYFRAFSPDSHTSRSFPSLIILLSSPFPPMTPCQSSLN